MSDENFISRWSRRKSESAAGTAGPTADSVPVTTGTQLPPPAGSAAPVAPQETPNALPPIDSLTPESDFAPFMKAEVDPGLKRQAFKKLIEDPRYNLMDGLDVYIDDYSKPDPLPEGWLEKMNQVKHLGIFKAAEDEALVEPETAPRPLPEGVAEAPLAQIEAAPPPDTFSDEIPPSEVGKSPPSRGGI